MARRRRSKTTKLINTRFFTRNINDNNGNASTMYADLSVTRGTEYRYDNEGERIGNKQTRYGNISGSIGFRDCSDSISFEFYASKKRKHAMRQLKVLRKIQATINEFVEKYEGAIRDLNKEGLLK